VVDRFSFTDMSIRIVGAPMAGGPSNPALAAAVANCGGLGFLAAGMVSAEQLAGAITATRQLTSGAIGVNIFVPQPRHGTASQFHSLAMALSDDVGRYGATLGEPAHDDDAWAEKLDVVCDLQPEVVSFTFGTPSKKDCCRIVGAGVFTLATVTTLDEARIALSCGVDGLVAQGPDACRSSTRCVGRQADSPCRLSHRGGRRACDRHRCEAGAMHWRYSGAGRHGTLALRRSGDQPGASRGVA
jgi:nitronate monooxygenase